MVKCHHNEYYEIRLSKEKNRGYLKLKGFWRNREVIKDYVPDVLSAFSQLKKGFTLVADLRDLKTPPLSVGPVHEEVQKGMLALGLHKTAEILSLAMLKMATDKYAKASKMEKLEFRTIEEGEIWLDSN